MRTHLALWGAASSQEACDADVGFCDEDGDPMTHGSPHGLFYVDAVLTYALAMDSLDRPSRENPDAVHEAILSLGPFDGASGIVRLDPETGDRDGTRVPA